MTFIIGLLGGAGSGKSTVAKYLEQNYGAKRYALADPLKQIAMKTMGFTEEQVYGTQAQKEAIDERYGVSPRTFLQRLGTEGMRAVFGPDVWVKHLLKQIAEDRPDIAVVEDCRFRNEASILREAGGEIWRLENPERVTVADASHASEAEWATAEFDRRIAPKKAGLDELYAIVKRSFDPPAPTETQSSISEWADATFGPSTPHRTALRAKEELDEAIEALLYDDLTKGVEEVADVFIVLYRIAEYAGVDIQDAIDRKMRINRARKWNLDGTGCGYHVKGQVSP